LIVGSVIAPEDKLHVIQCSNPKTVQSWAASLEKLWEWLKSQNTYKPIIEAIIQGLLQSCTHQAQVHVQHYLWMVGLIKAK